MRVEKKNKEKKKKKKKRASRQPKNGTQVARKKIPSCVPVAASYNHQSIEKLINATLQHRRKRQLFRDHSKKREVAQRKVDISALISTAGQSNESPSRRYTSSLVRKMHPRKKSSLIPNLAIKKQKGKSTNTKSDHRQDIHELESIVKSQQVQMAKLQNHITTLLLQRARTAANIIRKSLSEDGIVEGEASSPSKNSHLEELVLHNFESKDEYSDTVKAKAKEQAQEQEQKTPFKIVPDSTNVEANKSVVGENDKNKNIKDQGNATGTYGEKEAILALNAEWEGLFSEPSAEDTNATEVNSVKAMGTMNKMLQELSKLDFEDRTVTGNGRVMALRWKRALKLVSMNNKLDEKASENCAHLHMDERAENLFSRIQRELSFKGSLATEMRTDKASDSDSFDLEDNFELEYDIGRIDEDLHATIK